jgi:hypothetical protein
MNDEEVVVPSEEGQTEEVEQSQRPYRSISQSIDDVKYAVRDAGKLEENFGKLESKVAGVQEGGEKVTDAATNVGTATSSAAEKGAEAASKAAEAKAAAAEAAENSAKGAKEAARAEKAAAKVGKAASKGAEGVGEGMSAAGSSPHTAGLKASGEAVKAGGKVGEGLSTAAEAGATAAETGAATAEAGAKTAKEAAKAEKAAAEATKAGAQASKAGNQALNKAANSEPSSWLAKRGKFHQEHGKRLQEQANKFDSDKVLNNVFDKTGKFGKVLKGIAKVFDPKVIGVLVLLTLTIGTLFVSYILSPLLYMNIIIGTVSDPDRVEKVQNYLSGLGFNDSRDAFYEEVDYLNTHYGKQLDFSYIMSALYYVDIYYSGSETDYTDDTSKMCGNTTGDACGALQMGVQFTKNYVKEATTTTDESGLIYSANKLYRLRELAKHQFQGKRTKTVSLGDYIVENADKVQNENSNFIEYIPMITAYMIAHLNPEIGTAFDTFILNQEYGTVLTDMITIIMGTESFQSVRIKIENGQLDAGFIQALQNLLTTYFGVFANIKSVTIGDISSISVYDFESFKNAISVTYYEDSYNADAFEDYLIDYYIRYMPEFSNVLGKSTGQDLEDKINQIAYEIKLTKTSFDYLYKTDETAQLYGQCVGDIDLDLLDELTPPIDLTVGQTIEFDGSNNYGLYKGIMHKGVDLEESSTGTKAGDNVYSLYNGRVIESTLDGTYSDKKAKGGWLIIEYIVQYENSSLGNSKLSSSFKSKMSTIRVYYGGLDPNRMNLKQNDIVSKGDVIGYVGDSSVSETGKKPSVHFGIYDVKNSTFLNPINMFITCNVKGSGTSCTNGGDTVAIPSSVLDIKQINYDVEQYDERGFGGNGIDSSSPQKKVHQLWLDDGKRYTNGIAVIKVDGKDRYLVAVTRKFGDIGDIINANLENGEVIELVVADEKNYAHTLAVNNGELCDNEGTTDPGCYGHYKGSEGLGVLEFDFNPVEIYQNGIYSASALGQDWDTSQKVISISNCGSVFDQ